MSRSVATDARIARHAVSEIVPIKGRGALSNAEDRYRERVHEALDDGWWREPDGSRLSTSVMIDKSRSVITANRSPDLPFDQSINPYRGCEHGCVYCYARPTHAYLGLSPGLDFETKILVKPDAPALLRDELSRRGYRCRVIAMGTNTDAYQPLERRYRITRGILEVLQEYRHPVTITTKSSLIERDLDILAAMAGDRLAQVQVSVTTLDDELCRRLEPRTPAPRRRLRTVRALTEAGIPVTVLVAPVIPALNDADLESILTASAAAGAHHAAYILLRLPLEVKELFKEWLAVHAPLKAEHVMSLVRQCRAGKENDARFGRRMRGTGEYAELIAQRFRLAARRLGLDAPLPPLDVTRFRAPPLQSQLRLL